MKLTRLLLAAIIGLGMAGIASAEGDWYGSVQGGVNLQAHSMNQGFTNIFVDESSGEGSTGSPTMGFGSDVPVAFDTKFNTGWVVGGELGKRKSNGWRFGLEVSYAMANVDKHADFYLDGSNIGSLDSAIIRCIDTSTGLTVDDLLHDGRGEVSTIAGFFNAYYDFNREGRFKPYLGLGVGVAGVDVNYEPSGFVIANESNVAFAYQAKAGVSVDVSDRVELFTEYAYRGTTNVEVETQLFPGVIDIENRQNLIQAGIRVRFN